MPIKPNALSWLIVSAIVIALDQITKAIAIANLQPYVQHPVIPGVLNWTLYFNTGAAFSFLQDAGGWQRWLFSVLAVSVCAVLGVWLSMVVVVLCALKASITWIIGEGVAAGVPPGGVPKM